MGLDALRALAVSRDHIDKLCEDWARIRRQLLGLRDPLLASEYLGAVRSTLGQRRDLHAGARSDGRIEQHFPEVYLDESAVVQAAFRRMAPDLKQIMDVHYCVESPRSKSIRAELLGISCKEYWIRVSRAKAYVEGAFAVVDTVREDAWRQSVYTV